MDELMDVWQTVCDYFASLELSLAAQVILGILAFCFVVQAFYYIVYFCSVIRRDRRLSNGEVKHVIKRPAVSVVISTSDDNEHLQKYLPQVLDQNYPEYEVIVVNDGLTGETNITLDKLKEKHKHLYTTFLPEGAKFMSRRKMCITVGLKAAHYDYVVFTDSDCAPDSRDWLTDIMRNFTPDRDLVIGYNHPEQTFSGFFGGLVRFDALFSAIRYMGYALHGHPYKGNSSNMAFRKELFFKNRGFASNLNMPTGEDDIFVTEVATPTNTAAEVSPASVTTNHRTHTLRSFMLMKEGYQETSSRYTAGTKFRIGLEMTTRLLFYVSLIVALIYGAVMQDWFTLASAGVLALIRYCIQCYTFVKSAHVFREKGWAFMFIPYELATPLLTLYITTVGRIGKKKQGLWNA